MDNNIVAINFNVYMCWSRSDDAIKQIHPDHTVSKRIKKSDVKVIDD